MTNVIQPFHLLVIALAGWLNRHQQAVIDYLIEENLLGAYKTLRGLLGLYDMHISSHLIQRLDFEDLTQKKQDQLEGVRKQILDVVRGLPVRKRTSTDAGRQQPSPILRPAGAPPPPSPCPVSFSDTDSGSVSSPSLSMAN